MSYRMSVGKLLLDVRDNAREALTQESKGNRNLVACYVGKLRDLVQTLESITEEEVRNFNAKSSEAFHRRHSHDESGMCNLSENITQST